MFRSCKGIINQYKIFKKTTINGINATYNIFNAVQHAVSLKVNYFARDIWPLRKKKVRQMPQKPSNGNNLDNSGEILYDLRIRGKSYYDL